MGVDFPDLGRLVEAFERYLAYGFECVSLAEGELADAVSNHDFSCGAEVGDSAGLGDDCSVDVAVFLDGFTRCHSDSYLQRLRLDLVLEGDGEGESASW